MNVKKIVYSVEFVYIHSINQRSQTKSLEIARLLNSIFASAKAHIQSAYLLCSCIVGRKISDVVNSFCSTCYSSVTNLTQVKCSECYSSVTNATCVTNGLERLLKLF